MAATIISSVSPSFAQTYQCKNAILTRSPEFEKIVTLLNSEPSTLEAALPPIYRDQKLLVQIKKLKGKEKVEALRLYARQVIPKDLNQKAIIPIVVDYALVLAAGVKMMYDQHVGNVAPIDPGALTASLPATIAAADLTTGGIHFYLDNWASEDGPLGGAARAFRLHHDSPQGMDGNTYRENTGDTAKLLAPAFALAAAGPLLGAHIDQTVATSSLLFLVALMNSQTIHVQAHTKDPNYFFKVLQKARLLVSKAQHNKHHSAPFESDYASISSWTNPVTRNIWPALDKLFWRLSKKLSGSWIQDPSSIPPEVANDIKQGLTKIPVELILNTQAWEKRLPDDPDLREYILNAREEWRRDFIIARKSIYQSMQDTDSEIAKSLWREEQLDNPWIFGATPQELN